MQAIQKGDTVRAVRDGVTGVVVGISGYGVNVAVPGFNVVWYQSERLIELVKAAFLEDWFVYYTDCDGRNRSINTEMWEEWGDESDMKGSAVKVLARARREIGENPRVGTRR